MANMVLLDTKHRPVKFESIQLMLEVFYNFRLPYYQKRKDNMLKVIQAEINKLDLKIRFIQAILDKVLRIKNRVKTELISEMKEMGFPEELLKSGIGNLTKDDQLKAQDKIQKLITKREGIENTTPAQMWKFDLETFMNEYCKVYGVKNVRKPKQSLALIMPKPKKTQLQQQQQYQQQQEYQQLQLQQQQVPKPQSRLQIQQPPQSRLQIQQPQLQLQQQYHQQLQQQQQQYQQPQIGGVRLNIHK
jgi:DNA gyrase/topoisomerase IV subunit A